MALGQQLALEFRQKTTPPDNAAVSDYVKRVGAKLAAQLPSGWTYRIETIREDPQGGLSRRPYLRFGGADRRGAERSGVRGDVGARHGARGGTSWDAARTRDGLTQTDAQPWRACPLTGLA
jgi:hypothetical protein